MATWTVQGRTIIEAETQFVVAELPLRSQSRLGFDAYHDAMRRDEENVRIIAASREMLEALHLALGCCETGPVRTKVLAAIASVEGVAA